MTISVDKSVYTVRPGEVVPVRFKVVNTWRAQWGDSYLNKYRLALKSPYYNNGDLVTYATQSLTPGYKREGTFKLDTPSTEQRYNVELRLQIKRASDGKFLTDDKKTFVIETKFDAADIPEPDDIPSDPGFDFGKAEITQTNIGPGLVFNINSSINYSLRVMNTGGPGKLYGAIGLGYHDKDGSVWFTGRYANEQAQVPTGQTITWNGNIEVLHKDYAAREMTPRGPAVYFMSGHEQDNKIVWDRSEYIPVALELASGYVDPTDPEGVPDDWEYPIHDPSRPWDMPSFPSIFPDIWDIITPEPKEEEKEPYDLTPFIYIGFAGLIGYLLIRSQ